MQVCSLHSFFDWNRWSDPDWNISTGVSILRYNLTAARGDLATALYNYSGGPAWSSYGAFAYGYLNPVLGWRDYYLQTGLQCADAPIIGIEIVARGDKGTLDRIRDYVTSYPAGAWGTLLVRLRMEDFGWDWNQIVIFMSRAMGVIGNLISSGQLKTWRNSELWWEVYEQRRDDVKAPPPIGTTGMGFSIDFIMGAG